MGYGPLYPRFLKRGLDLLAGDPGESFLIGDLIKSTAKHVNDPEVSLPLHCHHDLEVAKAVGPEVS